MKPLRCSSRRIRAICARVAITTTNNTSLSAASEDEHETKQEQPTGKAECQGCGCSTPQQSNDKTGGEVADGVDRSQRSECHAVLLLRNEFGSKGVFERFLDSNDDSS